MGSALKRKVAAFLLVVPLVSIAVAEQPASAVNSVFPFAYNINATTHVKKLNQTVTVPQGTFIGGVDIETGKLLGSIRLPPATIKMKLAGIVPLVTATVKITQIKPVYGTVDLTIDPFPVVATATFSIQIVTAYAGIVPVNLVGNSCVTSTPVVVTMKGAADFGVPATFSGPYTIPPLKNCGTATLALNQVFPGPGNTFSAVATPQT